MLSQGGSRLNASKPEANPKTRYPLQIVKHNFSQLRRFPFTRARYWGMVSQNTIWSNRLSNHCCMRSLGGAKYIKKSQEYSPWTKPIPNNIQLTPNTTNKDPLQTREHAWAGISGMLRSLTGAQAAFTSRGAKPWGLIFMLPGRSYKHIWGRPLSWGRPLYVF